LRLYYKSMDYLERERFWAETTLDEIKDFPLETYTFSISTERAKNLIRQYIYSLDEVAKGTKYGK
jgi:hypothetical protein